MLTQPKFVSVYVLDQQRALDFFTGKLGFEVRTDASFGEGGRWVEVGIPGAATYLVLAAADQETDEVIRARRGPMSPVWFDSEDLDGTFRRFRDRGVEFPIEPQVAPWDPSGKTRWAQFSDPEGNVYGVSEYVE